MQASRNHSHCIVKLCSAALILLAPGCLIASKLGYRINWTPSLPVGIWKVAALTGPVQRGQIVSICPTDTTIFQLALARHYLSWGLCPGGYASLLKPVAAVAGDQVAISGQGIAINGVLVPNSQPLTKDSMGRPLIPVRAGLYIVRPGTVWLVSSRAQSFDSRYFGPLPAANILGRARPVLSGGSTQ
jgi:conjugative transfer signal peptidase TraF